jgi:hypothetical protein
MSIATSGLEASAARLGFTLGEAEGIGTTGFAATAEANDLHEEAWRREDRRGGIAVVSLQNFSGATGCAGLCRGHDPGIPAGKSVSAI